MPAQKRTREARIDDRVTRRFRERDLDLMTRDLVTRHFESHTAEPLRIGEDRRDHLADVFDRDQLYWLVPSDEEAEAAVIQPGTGHHQRLHEPSRSDDGRCDGQRAHMLFNPSLGFILCDSGRLVSGAIGRAVDEVANAALNCDVSDVDAPAHFIVIRYVI